MNISESIISFKEAQQLLLGSVDSPVHTFRAVGEGPFFIEHGESLYLFDLDCNRHIDYVLSWEMIKG